MSLSLGGQVREVLVLVLVFGVRSWSLGSGPCPGPWGQVLVLVLGGQVLVNIPYIYIYVSNVLFRLPAC